MATPSSFPAACAWFAEWAVANSGQNDQLLVCYALYKQATEGPCRAREPSVLKPKERAKWNAWAGLGDMNSDVARQLYVDEVNRLRADAGLAPL